MIYESNGCLKGNVNEYLELNENENATYKKLWQSVNAVLRGKCVIPTVYIGKKKFQINSLSPYLKELEKKRQK